MLILVTKTKLDETITKLWTKIKQVFATKEYVDAALDDFESCDHEVDTTQISGKIVLTKGNDSYAILAEKIVSPAAPTLPDSQTYTGSKTITVTDVPSGATVRYMTNGVTPTATSGNTGTSISLPQVNTGDSKGKTYTVKVVAVKNGMASSVITRNYTINRQLAAPTISNPGGTKYDSSRSVTITNNAVGGVRGTLKYKIANGEWITPTLTDNAVTISAAGDVTAVVELDTWESNTATKSVPVGAKKCYIGRTTGSSVNDLSALLNRKDINADTLAGREEENNFSAAGYVWFIVPSGQTITKVTSSGFDVPVELVANQISGYNCYRGVEDYVAGTFTFKFV